MNEISFDNSYFKFPYGLLSGDEVRLLEVLTARSVDLHQSFLDYDTTTADNTKYQIHDDEDVLVLLFIFKTELFTTIRKYTEEKERYYRSLRGSYMKVLINYGDDE